MFDHSGNRAGGLISWIILDKISAACAGTLVPAPCDDRIED
jgi:hypothetical protein